jgi:mannose-6-phosphate isomerase-like protein (cupin superfamily)
MDVRYLNDCAEFVAGDGSLLREFLHPDKEPLALRYSLAHATVPKGHTTTPHALGSSEVYYILSGQGRMHIDRKTYDVGPDCTVYIQPGAVQFIENTGRTDLKFLCVVDPAWRKEDEAILHVQKGAGIGTIPKLNASP